MTLPDASVAAAIAAIPPGHTLDPTTSPSALQTFINSLPSNSVGYLRGGTYASASASGTVRMNGTGVILKPYPGELVTYSGPQFGLRGEGNEVHDIVFNQSSVPGKCVEADGADNRLLRCTLTNNNGAGTAGGHCPMVLLGGSAQSTRFTAEDCFFHSIGKMRERNIFDHALYIRWATRARIVNNRAHRIRGGYFVHLYSGAGQAQVRTLVTGNRSNDSYFAMVALGARNTLLADNVMRNTLVGIRAPGLETFQPGAGNYYVNNKCHNTDTARGGASGIVNSGGCTVANTETGAFAFVDPAAGDFRIA